MKYQAVIFDFDDTLVKTREVKWQQHKAVAKQFYGIDLHEDVLAAQWGKPYDEVLRHIYENADTIENMRAAKLSLEDQFPIVAQEGVIEMIKRLQKKQVPLSILSSSLHDLVVNDLRRLGFPIEAFFMIQGSESTTTHKPDPAVFEPILSGLKQKGISEHIVYVGDSLSDYQAAKAAGLDFIAVTTGMVSREAFDSAGIKTILDKLSVLDDCLR